MSAQTVYSYLQHASYGSVAIKGNTITFTTFKSFPGESGAINAQKLTRTISKITTDKFSVVVRTTRNSIVIVVSF